MEYNKISIWISDIAYSILSNPGEVPLSGSLTYMHMHVHTLTNILAPTFALMWSEPGLTVLFRFTMHVHMQKKYSS